MIILRDFLNTFGEHSIECGEDQLITEKFYKIDRWDEDVYNSLFKKFEFHCLLVEDLVLELNRALNYILELIRKNIFYSYRLDLGHLYVTSGPHMDFSFRHHKAQYLPEQKIDIPYPGLDEFKNSVRFERDIWFGKKT